MGENGRSKSVDGARTFSPSKAERLALSACIANVQQLEQQIAPLVADRDAMLASMNEVISEASTRLGVRVLWRNGVFVEAPRLPAPPAASPVAESEVAACLPSPPTAPS